jgi:hypothetical protein
MPGFAVEEVLFDVERNIISTETSITTSLDNISLNQEIKVYPNPVSETLFIDVPEGLRVTGYALRDLNGKTVSGYVLRDAGLISIPVGDLPKGVYFLEIDLGGSTVVKKVVRR